jgi:hypothetical protein
MTYYMLYTEAPSAMGQFGQRYRQLYVITLNRSTNLGLMEFHERRSLILG